MRNIEIGSIVTLVLAIGGGIYSLGKMDARITSLETTKTDLIELEKKFITKLDEKIESLSTLSLPVGTIVSSGFSPTDFFKLYGGNIQKEWVPADGREIPKTSKYAKIKNEYNIPDLRGLFIRGLNEFEQGKVRNDGKEDPAGKGRVYGEYQVDSFKKHSHSFVLPQHKWGKVSGTTLTIGNGGNASHETSHSSDAKETRPRNIAVYYYIKIN